MSARTVGTMLSRFQRQMRQLESAYLQSDDCLVQSGFGGGQERWVAERSPLINGIDGDGDFLDVGCANGQLALDVVCWAAHRGFSIEPHGVDLGTALIARARAHLPEHAPNFIVADAWTWEPHRQWRFVYSTLELSPPEQVCAWLSRLSEWVVPEGRLIVGSYGSKSRSIQPTDVASALSSCGFEVLGWSEGGDGPVTRFAWAAPS